MGFEHYKNFTPGKRNTLLQDIIASRTAKEAADRAERNRRSHLKHKANMEGFRAWAKNLDLTDEEKAAMIKASFSW